ncbi:MAG TPA: translation factor GTPase family protein, partial [Streptosporangiaceae bacterium]
LFDAGVIGEVGSVDAGSTQTDTLALERQRGITIRSAVVAFAIGDVAVNLIDTPGHPDFIAEVERVLSVLDGAVLVVSAVEGVQAQTRILLRALRRLGIPTLIFVNKIDRAGAGYEQILAGIAGRLMPSVVAMGSVCDLGTKLAAYVPFGDADAGFAERLADLLAVRSDAVLAEYVTGAAGVPYAVLRKELAVQAGRCQVHPVFFGSAMTGAGTADLAAGIAGLLPGAAGDPDGVLSGSVFKIDRGAAGERLAYARIFDGTLRTRDTIRYGSSQGGNAHEGRITGISVFANGGAVSRPGARAGQIARLQGLADVQVGDPLGIPHAETTGHYFAPPTLETVVMPAHLADKGALQAGLATLAEQDPLINLRQDDVRGELLVSLYGEVQKEVIAATLAADFGLAVSFRDTTVICIERLAGPGEAAEAIKGPGNPFLATIGLRIQPAEPGTGIQFRLGVEPGAMPPAFFRAVEDTVRQTLRQGLRGWEVPDCVVTMTRSGYWPRQSAAHQGFSKAVSSTGEDFRGLTPLVLMDALRQAGTKVCEPVASFRLEVPADCTAAVLTAVAKLGGTPLGPQRHGAADVIEGEIPAGQVHTVQLQLPSLTRGEGLLETEFARYQPVRGEPPSRHRTDNNPLNRREYLLAVQRGVRSAG